MKAYALLRRRQTTTMRTTATSRTTKKITIPMIHVFWVNEPGYA